MELVAFHGFDLDPQQTDEETEKRAAALHAHEFGSCDDRGCPLRLSLLLSSSSLTRSAETVRHEDAEQPQPLVLACRLLAAIEQITARALLTSNQVMYTS